MFLLYLFYGTIFFFSFHKKNIKILLNFYETTTKINVGDNIDDKDLYISHGNINKIRTNTYDSNLVMSYTSVSLGTYQTPLIVVVSGSNTLYLYFISNYEN